MNFEQEMAIAYAETWQILQHLPQNLVDQIPHDRMCMYEKYRDKNHEFHVDPEKLLSEQEMSRKTRAIIANLYIDYWATPEEREAIREKDEQELKEMRLRQYKSMLEDEED